MVTACRLCRDDAGSGPNARPPASGSPCGNCNRLLRRPDSNPRNSSSIRNVRRMEFRWALAAFLGVLVFGTLQGIVVAIVLSLVGLSSQAANPRIHVVGRKRGGIPSARSPRNIRMTRPSMGC